MAGKCTKPSGGGDWVCLTDAARQLNTTRWTIRKYLNHEGIPLWRDPLDHRSLLVLQTDLDRLAVPRLVGSGPVGES